ncbi:MAG: hypothetical protein AAF806_23620 [Bacteroidota bacterium]
MKSTHYLSLILLFFIFNCASIEKDSVMESALDIEEYILTEAILAKFDSSIAIGDLESAQYFLAKLFQQDSISEEFQRATVELKALKNRLEEVN